MCAKLPCSYCACCAVLGARSYNIKTLKVEALARALVHGRAPLAPAPERARREGQGGERQREQGQRVEPVRELAAAEAADEPLWEAQGRLLTSENRGAGVHLGVPLG